MKKENVKIKCPNCLNDLEVNKILVAQFEDRIREDLENELRERQDELLAQKLDFRNKTQELEKEKLNLEEQIHQRVSSSVKSREAEIRKKLKTEIESERSKELELLEEELKEKSSKLIELNQTKAKLQQLSREFEEKEAQIHLRKEQELNERLKQERQRIRDESKFSSALEMKEKENIIDSLKKKLEEAQQRIEQGSMQMQGEAQELLLEAILREANPRDVIDEIKKGARGADCLQTIYTQSGKIAGKILFESKNTKNWSDSFISKLKEDNLQTKADLMVLVTKSLPPEMEGKYCLIDGVWVTTLAGVRDLSLLLRFGILKTYSLTLSQTGRKDKMHLLYDYLTSEEFKATFESILQGFKNLQDLHAEEQRKMQLVWKKRAKHLELVLSSTIDFYGSIRGISSTSIPVVEMLEMKQAS